MCCLYFNNKENIRGIIIVFNVLIGLIFPQWCIVMFLETLSPEDQSDKGQSQASQRVVRKRSERFYEITCRTPGRGLVLLCKTFTTRLTGGCQHDVFSLCACFNLNLSIFWYLNLLFCSSASVLQQARPDGRPFWRQCQWSEIQKTESCYGEEGKVNRLWQSSQM